jgi:hypothetical protein
MTGELEWMTTEQDQEAVDRAELSEWSTVGLWANICNLVDTVQYCGGAHALDSFLNAVQLNFNSHSHLFTCGGPVLVKYAFSLLAARRNQWSPTLGQRRWQTLQNGQATYLWNLTDAYRTLTSFHKIWLMLIGIRTDDGWRWSCRCSDAFNLRKTLSEPMSIIWNLIGDMLSGINRSMKKFSTILTGKASATLTRTKLDWYSQPEADLRAWTNPSIWA